METFSKPCIVRMLLFGLFVLLFTGCATTEDYRSFYYMDLRSYPIPVMINEDPEAQPGRQFRAVVSSESSVQQTSSYGYGYTVTTTTTRSAETTTPLDTQLLQRSSSGDNLIRVRQINFSTYAFGMPYYSERRKDMSVDVSYHMQ